MEIQKYPIGIVVKLNSGGPEMTINAFGTWYPKDALFDGSTLSHKYGCIWFNGNEKQGAWFKEEEIKRSGV
ncbi:hypothetical protein LCGC14_1389550 [marine sediment metagenome]|uniref:Uncharacterized protein n=1 Tax=marine sediment metagenome TaxID=412755 RepID=A0A0F9KL52_9ZZZZ